MAHLPKASNHHAKASSDALDTEMTSPLTSNDSGSTRSHSPSQSPFKGMSPIDNQKYSRPGNFARTNTAPNPMAASWRRDGYTTGPTAPPDMGSYTAPPNMNPYTSSSNMGSYGAAQYDPNYPIMPGPYENSRPRGNSMMGENHVPLSSVRPGPFWPSEAQLSMAYGYGIQRDDGTITRLIRADELDEMHAVPRSQGPEGLIILPPPRQFSPTRCPGPEQMIPSNVNSSLHSPYHVLVLTFYRYYNSFHRIGFVDQPSMPNMIQMMLLRLVLMYLLLASEILLVILDH
jgi:hypothetical protein